MKKLFLLILVTVLTSSFALAQKSKQGTIAYLDEKRGFKSITLGDDESTLHDNFTLDKLLGAAPVQGLTIYSTSSPHLMKVGKRIILKNLRVGVYRGKITMIWLRLDKENGRLLHETFKNAYGQGRKAEGNIDEYSWHSQFVMIIFNREAYDLDDVTMFDSALLFELLQSDDQTVEEDQDAIEDI